MAIGIESGITWFAPIFAFLFVMIVTYAVLHKTEVIGSNDAMKFLVSFIIASFFILEAQLVDYVEFITGWAGAILIVIFFALILLAFATQKSDFKFISGNKSLQWIVLATILVGIFVSSSYVFNWVINWDLIGEWLMTDWFGFVLLIILGFGAYFFIKKSK